MRSYRQLLTIFQQKDVEAPAAVPSGPKAGLKSGFKAALGIGKENNPGASSSRDNEQELQSRAPSSRPNGS